MRALGPVRVLGPLRALSPIKALGGRVLRRLRHSGHASQTIGKLRTHAHVEGGCRNRFAYRHAIGRSAALITGALEVII